MNAMRDRINDLEDQLGIKHQELEGNKESSKIKQEELAQMR
jgi:hypothetical protein